MYNSHQRISFAIYPTFYFKVPQSHLAPVETLVATFLAPSFSSPDQYFYCIFLIPFSPKLIVLLPKYNAFSLADYNNSQALISFKGMSYLYTYRPTYKVGCTPISFPSRIPLQQAAAFDVILVRIQKFYSPYIVRKFLKLSFPPLYILWIYQASHVSKPILLILVTQFNCLNNAAHPRHRKIAWERSPHCLLALPHWKHTALAYCANKCASGCSLSFYINSYNPLYQEQGNKFINMNLKIDRVLPYPPSVAEPYIFTYLPSLQALLLYPPPPQPEKQEQPSKKKFGFKANNNAAPTIEQVYIFEFTRSAWRTQQTKGKFPTRREFPAVTCMGPCMMVYGGKQINPAKQVNDLYCLNLTSWQWKKLFAMEAPTPFPNPQAYAINDQSLLVVGKQLWVFNTKGVNWQLQKGDLPGGIWEKVQGCQMSFELRCGTRMNNNLIVFGWDGNLRAATINIQTKSITNIKLEGEFKGKGERIQIANTSEGKAIIVDGLHFGSFTLLQNNLYFSQWATSQQVIFQKFIPAHLQDKTINYGISSKKQLALVQLIIQHPEESQEELPNTSRQIEADYMKSSLIEKNIREEQSPLSHSQVKEDKQNTDSLTKYLCPLLYAEWMKRRVLQSKSKLLQDSIKKAEKMVLSLCRYGGEEDKRGHINKVRKIRQNLSESFNRQTYIRREMENLPGHNVLRQFAIREYGEMSEGFQDFDN